VIEKGEVEEETDLEMLKNKNTISYTNIKSIGLANLMG